MRKNGEAGGSPLGRTLARRRAQRRAPSAVGLAADHPCFDCAQCCRYVAIEIDAPTAMHEYDYLIWYLVHPGVSVFVDFDGGWFVKFETRCRHLEPTGMCGIYETRPVICREFDHNECERQLGDEPADKWLSTNSDEFLSWFERQRPKAFRRFREWQSRHRKKRMPKELGRVRKMAPWPPRETARR